MFDVFLSHHSADKPWVIALKAELVERGLTVWLDHDEIRPGDRFVEALQNGVQNSRNIVVIVSPGSTRSKWVQDEWERALQLANSSETNVRVIPCLLSGGSVPGFLATRQFVDFRNSARFDEAVDELYFGITGTRADRHVRSHASTPPLLDIEVTGAGIAFLDKRLAYARKGRQRLMVLWAVAPTVGFLAGLGWWSTGIPYLMLAIGSALTLGFIALGTTFSRWSSLRIEIESLGAHRDALEFCAHNISGACPDVLAAFERLLRRSAGIESPASGVRI